MLIEYRSSSTKVVPSFRCIAEGRSTPGVSLLTFSVQGGPFLRDDFYLGLVTCSVARDSHLVTGKGLNCPLYSCHLYCVVEVNEKTTDRGPDQKQDFCLQTDSRVDNR